MPICKVCETKFENEHNKRPKEYCSDNCRELVKFYNAFHNRLLKVQFKNKSANKLKRDLFVLANTSLICK